jgi:hypothetical protein
MMPHMCTKFLFRTRDDWLYTFSRFEICFICLRSSVHCIDEIFIVASCRSIELTDFHMASYASSTGVFVLLFQATPTRGSGTP